MSSLRLTFLCCGATAAARSMHFPGDQEPVDALTLCNLHPLHANWADVDSVFVAPEVRALETALAFGLEAQSVEILRDRNLGDWIGCSLPEVLSGLEIAAIDSFNFLDAPPNGESCKEVQVRIAQWLDQLPKQGKILAITHPSVVRAAIIHALNAAVQCGAYIDVLPLHATKLTHDGRRFMLRSSNIPMFQQSTRTIGTS